MNSSKQVLNLMKEVKLWKERYFVEKKCRKLIENWTLHAFGFDVRAEYEQSTSSIRIQGIENKDAMKTAAVPNESEESEMRVVVMEGKISPEDFLEDEDELEQNEIETQTQNMIKADICNDLSGSDQSHLQSQITSANSSGGIIGGQQQFHQQAIEVSENGENPQEVYYIGNYDENNITSGQQYYILKSGDNEEMPMQLDYSSYFNGDINASQDKQQVYYRIVTPSEASNNAISPESPVNTNNTPQPSPVKRKAPPQNSNINVKSPNSKAKKKVPEKTQNKNIPNISEMEYSPSSTFPSALVIPHNTKPTTTNAMKINEEKIHVSPIEFGLTLREKAEIYVRSKATEALRKIGSGYECKLCTEVKYVYNSFENAITHTKSHFDSKPYKCEFCSEIFAVQREVLHHRKNVHPKSKGSPAINSKSNTVKKIAVSSYQNLIQVVSSPAIPIKSSSINNSNSKPLAVKSIKPNLIATPKDKTKPFKCQKQGCEWSYSTSEELSWHMKAHQQNRI